MHYLNRQSASARPEGLVTQEIIDIRVNPRNNVMAIDISHAAALKILRNVTEVGGINVLYQLALMSSLV